jgi:hypothetical protein
LKIEVPKEVVDTFSAGLKYLSPIAMKKSLVKVSWAEFCERAMKSWALGSFDDDDQGREKEDDEDTFYTIPIPFKLSGFVEPFKGRGTRASSAFSRQDGQSLILYSRMCLIWIETADPLMSNRKMRSSGALIMMFLLNPQIKTSVQLLYQGMV